MINYLVISDIHLGHRKNPISNIARNLLEYLNKVILAYKLDLVFIAGDTFDRPLELRSEEAQEAITCLYEIIKLLSKHKIKLRVLEGTPSHDWKCSSYFVHLANISNLPIDLRYIKSLSVEVIEDLNLSVLYVPDEWHPDTNETFKQAKELVLSKGLSQVDIALMHGCFNYQLPSAAKNIPRHNEHDYLSLVKYYINIGHVHVYSVYERIIAQGSTDRLAHSEESPKGGVVVSIDKDNEPHYTFIENENAMIFKTINITSNNLDVNLNKIKKVISNLPIHSHVRIRANKNNSILLAYAELKNQYPLVNLTKITIEDEEIQNSKVLIDEVEQDTTYIPITLDRDNIIELVTSNIKNRENLSDTEVNQLHSQLKEVVCYD